MSDNDRREQPSMAPRIVVDKCLLGEVLKFVRKSRPQALTEEERLDILLLQAKLRYEHNENVEKVGKGRRVKNGMVTRRVAQLLNRKKDLVAKVWADFVSTGSLRVAPTAANRSKRPSIVPDLRVVANSLQEFFRIRRRTRSRTVAKDVMYHLQ